MKEETMWICPNIISLEEATKTYPVCVGGWCVLKKKKEEGAYRQKQNIQSPNKWCYSPELKRKITYDKVHILKTAVQTSQISLK